MPINDTTLYCEVKVKFFTVTDCRLVNPCEKHSGRGFTYFSCYGNSILYNEGAEKGGYTIQLYHIRTTIPELLP